MSWSKTLADEPELMRRFWADAERGKTFDATKSTTMVFAPCCGRRTAADTVIDCRSIQGTIVRGANVRPAADHDWLCDGCVHILYRDQGNDWTLSKMLIARGAPSALVDEHRLRELVEADARAEFAQGGIHDPTAARQRIAVELAARAGRPGA